ncbi:hypothetical protein HanRHA438_Chr01g0034551 [Helianthus annuus]|nr:hypothetical protein HanRHA438_Chr01g0034551 [Helianthus annuus]
MCIVPYLLCLMTKSNVNQWANEMHIHTHIFNQSIHALPCLTNSCLGCYANNGCSVMP